MGRRHGTPTHIAITQFSERASAAPAAMLGWSGDIGTLVLMVWLLWFGMNWSKQS